MARRATTERSPALPAPAELPQPARAAPAGYSGTPLPKKLGIKEGAVVALIDAPPGVESILTPLPPAVRFARTLRGKADLIVWFVRDRSELVERIAGVRRAVGRDGVWIAWPKKASRVATDVSENIIRDAGLAEGLVDYKVCAIDQTWSGLKFAVRKTA